MNLIDPWISGLTAPLPHGRGSVTCSGRTFPEEPLVGEEGRLFLTQTGNFLIVFDDVDDLLPDARAKRARLLSAPFILVRGYSSPFSSIWSRFTRGSRE